MCLLEVVMMEDDAGGWRTLEEAAGWKACVLLLEGRVDLR